MPKSPSQTAKNVEGDFGAFERALKTVLSVPHSKIKAQLDAEKRRKYAWMRVPFYVIYDPQRQVMAEVLTVYRLQGVQYERQHLAQFPELKLSLTLWQGEFEGKVDTWLRWTDEQGVLIPTGKERAEQEHQRAEQEHQRAEQERQRAERFAELLRKAGIDPERT